RPDGTRSDARGRLVAPPMKLPLSRPSGRLPKHRSTPDPSEEGSKHSCAPGQFPSWVGLGVGPRAQCAHKVRRILSLWETAALGGKQAPVRLGLYPTSPAALSWPPWNGRKTTFAPAISIRSTWRNDWRRPVPSALGNSFCACPPFPPRHLRLFLTAANFKSRRHRPNFFCASMARISRHAPSKGHVPGTPTRLATPSCGRNSRPAR